MGPEELRRSVTQESQGKSKWKLISIKKGNHP